MAILKKYRKTIFEGLFFVAIVAITFYCVFKGEDLSSMLDAIKSCRVGWLIPSVACVVVFIFGESLVIWYMMRSYGIGLKKSICFLFSCVGFFFSCVTPSASGGQPMQIYFMKKEGIPIPISTVVLMIVTITYKAVLVAVGIGIMIFGRSMLSSFAGEAEFLFYLGIVLNVACVAGMCLLVFHPVLTKNILEKLVKLLEKLHLMKHKPSRLEKLESSMELYADTARYIRKHAMIIVNVFIITILQRFAMFAVTYFVYRSFSLEGTDAMTIMMLQAVISLAVDMLPLPGGMGISEGLFLLLFKPIFGAYLMPGLFLSRGLGYYSELIISAVMTMVAAVVFNIRYKKRVAREAAEAAGAEANAQTAKEAALSTDDKENTQS